MGYSVVKLQCSRTDEEGHYLLPYPMNYQQTWYSRRMIATE